MRTQGGSKTGLPRTVPDVYAKYIEECVLGDRSLEAGKRFARAALGHELAIGQWFRIAELSGDINWRAMAAAFQSAGVLESNSDAADPRYRFACDPVSEYLAVLDWMDQFVGDAPAWHRRCQHIVTEMTGSGLHIALVDCIHAYGKARRLELPAMGNEAA